MISYELALKLKETGFPQEPEKYGVGSFYWKRKNCWGFTDVAEYNNEEIEYQKRCYKIPTLSELIEACGDGFRELYKSEKIWFALYFPVNDDGNKLRFEIGQTPEEAVAKLWLKLNKK